jgi:hypothetical protein
MGFLFFFFFLILKSLFSQFFQASGPNDYCQLHSFEATKHNLHSHTSKISEGETLALANRDRPGPVFSFLLSELTWFASRLIRLLVSLSRS